MKSSSMPRRCVLAASDSFVAPASVSCRVADACVGRARLLADVARTLEPLEQPRDAGRGQQHALREVDAAQHPVVGIREMEQHLVVVQRQSVLALQLRGELAGDRRVRAKERDPGLELLRWCRDGGGRCHTCALKCSAANPPAGAVDRFPYMRRESNSLLQNGIEVEGLVRLVQGHPGGRRHRHLDPAGRDLRLSRAERRGKVDHGAHADDPPPAERRARDGRRLRRPARGRRRCGPRSAPPCRRRRSTRS